MGIPVLRLKLKCFKKPTLQTANQSMVEPKDSFFTTIAKIMNNDSAFNSDDN